MSIQAAEYNLLQLAAMRMRKEGLEGQRKGWAGIEGEATANSCSSRCADLRRRRRRCPSARHECAPNILNRPIVRVDCPEWFTLLCEADAPSCSAEGLPAKHGLADKGEMKQNIWSHLFTIASVLTRHAIAVQSDVHNC